LAKVSQELDIYVEWSVNEKVALEVAAAASLGGMRGLTAMKQNGLNVAVDTLFVMNMTGTIGGLVVVVCDDPSALSSGNEEDSRSFAKMGNLPLFEPSNSQEAKEMTRWAFELSEELGIPCLIRSVTRVSHQRGNVNLEQINRNRHIPHFDKSRPVIPLPVVPAHQKLNLKMANCRERFDGSSLNFYRGPGKPDLLVITSGASWMYALEVLACLDVEDRVGIIKLGTTWPLPESFLLKHLKKAKEILFMEEVDPFLEDNIKAFYAQNVKKLGVKTFWGKASGTMPAVGEMTPDIAIEAVQKLLKVEYHPRPAGYSKATALSVQSHAPLRELGFCAGCPHRATFWAIKNALMLDDRDGFVLGDIGCYSLGLGPSGFNQISTILAMGSGAGLACGFGRFEQFGSQQPVIAVCGDSTFFHATIPALLNARYNNSNFLLLVLDNSATAMTGFQPHPGTGRTAVGDPTPVLEIASVCNGIGVDVEVVDPFNLKETTETIYRLLQERDGTKVLVLRQECALVRGKRETALYKVHVNQEQCLGKECGCNRFCTRIFKCPGLVWDAKTGKAKIDVAICTQCGICSEICPQAAIIKEIA